MKAIDIQKPISYNQRLMSENTATQNRLKPLVAAALFAALTTIGAQIKIPLPAGVPMTMQTFFVILSGFLLGSSYGPISQMLYVFAGLLGFPIFAEGGGPAYILKPTFGYLLGYPLASFPLPSIVLDGLRSADFMANRYHLGTIARTRLFLAGAAGILAVFIPGVSYLYFATNYILQVAAPFVDLLSAGFLIFIPGDLVKLTAIVMFVSVWAIKKK